MPTHTLAKQNPTSPVDELVRRARSLYSLPAVAAEVIQLTNNPQVDTRALKECIQADPALTAKLLRVVNSSLFGLSREVCDLNQALALLGTKPLKLLVLGFSLPENMFSEVAREQLDWYWSTTLARAVAAKEISEQWFGRPGDDAFLAGLFQDIGVLVLLGELKEPYAKFLTGVIEQKVELQQLETDSLGFDHLQLTAALLEHWNMPQLLIEALSTPRNATLLTKSTTDESALAKVVHLAELVSELISRNRISILPELLEIGGNYCQLDKQQLTQLVEELQPKVNQLAEVLSLELTPTDDYTTIMANAHLQMSELTEEVAPLLARPPVPPVNDEQAYNHLLSDAQTLRAAVDQFLKFPTVVEKDAPAKQPTESKQLSKSTDATAHSEEPIVDNVEDKVSESFTTQLTLAIGHCRSRRQSLSLVMLEVGGKSCGDAQQRALLGQILARALQGVDAIDAVGTAVTPCRWMLLLPNYERHEAVRLTEEIIQQIQRMTQRLEGQGTYLEYVTSAGVSSVALPPKNFPPNDLFETAERCLSAAQSSGIHAVKSLEIY